MTAKAWTLNKTNNTKWGDQVTWNSISYLVSTGFFPFWVFFLSNCENVIKFCYFPLFQLLKQLLEDLPVFNTSILSIFANAKFGKNRDGNWHLIGRKIGMFISSFPQGIIWNHLMTACIFVKGYIIFMIMIIWCFRRLINPIILLCCNATVYMIIKSIWTQTRILVKN